ncbi:MAG: InlB B-repeat-containing protein [Oscillospiraceae bacterium]|nr:InlB B-repeat-containing protein [Oscillospiraceae bacterium]
MKHALVSGRRKGFTLLETLGALVIVVILLGVAFLAGSNMISGMRQKKLDTIAQNIYVTAQERMTGLFLEGCAVELDYEPLDPGMALVSARPSDWDLNANPDASGVAFTSLTALGNDISKAAAERLLPEGSLHREVYDNHWIIEYNPEYGYIYGVFYSEKPFASEDGGLDSLSDWYPKAADYYRSSFEARKAAGIGYYGGIGVVAGKVVMSATSLNVTLNIINAEELRANIAVKVPAEYKEKLVRVVLSFREKNAGPDGGGAEYTYNLDLPTTGSRVYGYYNREETVVLDSLADENGKYEFWDRKPANVNNFLGKMTAGADISLTATAYLSTEVSSYREDTECDTAEAMAEFNSLFEKLEGTTAYVSYGRHLQNLNSVNKPGAVSITNAVQTANIDFRSTSDDFDGSKYKKNVISSYDVTYWAEAYYDSTDASAPFRKFIPINGVGLLSYDGGSRIINGMTIAAAPGENAGLFSVLGSGDADISVSDLGLVGTMISGSAESSGAIAGGADGRSITLSGVGAYLAMDDFYGRIYSSPEAPHISGNTAGGLIGNVSGNVSARECFAAGVLRANAAAGGLFGSVGGSMRVSSSYSDCYISCDGGIIGGLASSCGSDSEIVGSYTAGFVTGTPSVSAGFVPSLCNASSSYTVLHLGDPSHYETAYYATVSAGEAAFVYYATPEEDEGRYIFRSSIGTEKPYSDLASANAGDKTSLLSAGSFNTEAGAGNTTAYNMEEGLGLTKYPYPYIKKADGGVLHHYGDWAGSLFNPGALVYFELYTDGTAGYAGAGNSFLSRGKTVLRDGYALLYSGKYYDSGYGRDTAVLTYGDNLSGKTEIPGLSDASRSYSVTKSNGTSAYYYFRELPYGLLNKSAGAYLFGGNAAASDDGFYAFIKVETPDTSELDNRGLSHYFFNPCFASTVIEAEGPSEKPSLASEGKNIISIRTARQFYLLSENYDGLHAGYLITGTDASGRLIRPMLNQELDIDYGSYDWSTAGFGADPNVNGEVKIQRPVSDYGVGNKFNVSYNGNCHILTGFGIESATPYAGLFGRIGRGGRLQNIVYAAEADSNLSVGFGASHNPGTQGQPAYVGVLAAYNEGTIDNCAVSGLRLNLNTYNGSTIYAGGLVGYNNRQISSCSAGVPEFTVNTTRSNGYIGGFVGYNNNGTDETGLSVRGTISKCYSLASINVTRWTSGTVRVAGFAGTNAGSVDNCYTICAMEMSNISESYVDGFTFAGGSVDRNSCLFITSGTYKYAGKIYAYAQTSATAKAANSRSSLPNFIGRDEDMPEANLEGFGNVSSSFFHGSTSPKGGELYPFGSSVKAGNTYVHYGDWITDDVLGNVGMVYWEHEEHGANDGYRFLIRFGSGENDIQTTLCSAHDDGGIVTEYGYGYYYLDNTASITVPNVSFSGVNTPTPAYRNGRAEKDIQNQFSGEYQFVLYNTTDPFSDSATGLYVNGANAWASATMLYQERVGEYFEVKSVSYSFSPFFGAAIESGTAAPKNLQVRSINQLQFINWKRGSASGSTYNYGTTKQSVTGGNYRDYIYLGQYNSGSTSAVSRSNALNRTVFDWTWNQTHDIKLPASGSNFTPIAGSMSTSSSSAYNATLYAWFGSTYDGNSYKIEDINISSDCFTVGLFGVTAGATMQNIIMYTENGAAIMRSSKNTGSDGAYSLGGLVGVVYDYANEVVKIENCAIAGYRIIDNSKNKQTLGEANVGGLVGVCNGNIIRCSAIVDIEINCTHRDSAGNFTRATYGNYIRTGGIAGAVMRTVEKCYSGGSISVGSDTLKENRSDNNGSFVSDSENRKVDFLNYSTSIYVAGIGGSGFAQNYQNFSGKSGSRDENPSFKDCYTYMEFPRLGGTIRSISVIGSVADRYAQSSYVTITNCYYLDSVATPEKLLPVNLNIYYQDTLRSTSVNSILSSAFTASTNRDTLYELDANGRRVSVSSYTYFDKMIDGSSVAVNKVLKNQSNTSKSATISLTKLTLPQLEGLALSGFGNVTTLENGISINGKYSFPAGDASLQGENYPYPAVITQKSDVMFNDDGSRKTVFVHYGAWPKGTGLFSSKGVINLDLLPQTPDENGVVLNKDRETVTVSHYSNFVQNALKAGDISITFTELDEYGRLIQDAASSEIVKISKITGSADGKSLDLTIIGNKAGEATVKITCCMAGHSESIEISVTVEAVFGLEITPVIKKTQTVNNPDGTTGEEIVFIPVRDEGYIPESYQWDMMQSDKDNLYWLLNVVNENSVPDAQGKKAVITGMKPANWIVDPSSMNEEYDGYDIIEVDNMLYLRFHSTLPGDHTIVVTASDIPGVDGQKVNGTRYSDLSFRIKQNPPTVYVYPFPYGTESELNTIKEALYWIEGKNAYACDKDGEKLLPGGKLLPVSDEKAMEAGFEEFGGYFARFEKYGLVTEPRFTEYNKSASSADGNNRIVYEDHSFDILNVYGKWGFIEYSISFDLSTEARAYGVKLPAGVRDKYTVKDAISLPYPVLAGLTEEPLSFTTSSGKTMVFCGWRIGHCEENSGWTENAEFRTDDEFEIASGKRGDVSFSAIWNEKCTVSYYDGSTKYSGCDTDYIAGAASVSLFVPADDLSSDKIFIGWKLKGDTLPAGAGGWAPGTVYRGNEIHNTENFCGSVSLEAVWDEAYFITYRLPVTGKSGTASSCIEPNAKYPAHNSITISSVSDFAAFSGSKYLGEIPAALAFRSWTLSENGDNNAAWASAGASIVPGTELINTAASVVYSGNVTLTASFDDSFTLKYDLGFTPEDASTVYAPVGYSFSGSAVTIPSAPERRGYEFRGWKVYASEEGSSIGNWPSSLTPGTAYSGRYGNVTITASWELKEYKVFFEKEEGESTYTYTINGQNPGYNSYQGYTIESGALLPVPEKDGYRFSGWKQAGHNINTEWPAPGEMFGQSNEKLFGLTGDVYLIPVFTAKNSEITYKINGKVFDVQEYENGDVSIAVLPENRYSFIQGTVWKVESSDDECWTLNSSVRPGSTQIGKKGNVTLSASGTVRTFSITYWLKTGDTLTELTELRHSFTSETESLTFAKIPSEDGFYFGSSWIVYETSGEWTKGDAYAPESELTLIPCGGLTDIKLVVSKEEVTYNIYYKVEILRPDGSSTGNIIDYCAPVSYSRSSPVSIEALPERNGYVIEGWSVSGEGSNWGESYIGGGSTLYNRYGDVTLTCTRKPLSYTISYTVNGRAIEGYPKKYTADDIITIEEIPFGDKDTYAYFGSWINNSPEGDWGTAYTAGESIGAGHYGNVSFEGGFGTGSISFKPGRGAMPGQSFKVRADYGGSAFGDIFYGAYPAPSVGGNRTLEGWYGNINSVYKKLLNPDGSIAAGVTADELIAAAVNGLEVYAEYTHSIRLNYSGNSLNISVTEDYEGNLYISGYSAPKGNGRILDGWYTSRDGNGTRILNADGSVFTSSELMDTDELYARWGQKRRTLERVTSLSEGDKILISSVNLDSAGEDTTIRYLTLNSSDNAPESKSLDVVINNKRCYLYADESGNYPEKLEWNVGSKGSYLTFNIDGNYFYESNKYLKIGKNVSNSYRWKLDDNGTSLRSQSNGNININNGYWLSADFDYTDTLPKATKTYIYLYRLGEETMVYSYD